MRTTLFIFTLFVACVLYAQPRRHPMNVGVRASMPSGALRRSVSVDEAPLISVGSPRIPVLLVQYNDLKFSVASTDDEVLAKYELFFNAPDGVCPGTEGYESCCSVREYFNRQSSGQFTPQFSVMGPITLSDSYAFYGRNSGSVIDANISHFYRESCSLAVSQYDIDWSVFDNNSDGKVDCIIFIYAGEGENNSDDENTIWPKESGSSMDVVYDDKTITFGSFACTNELFETIQDGVGPVIHEFCHALGLPDFYDTGYVAFGMDMWDIMDSGCYQIEGRHPCNLTSYERDFLGWQSPIVLSADTICTLSILPYDTSGQAYRINNPAGSDEYILLENRQNLGLDTYFGSASLQNYDDYGPCHGLMAIHVDYLYSAWYYNRVNITPSHQRMTIIPADGELISNIWGEGYSEEWARSLRGDLYPGSDAATELTSYSAFKGGSFPFTISGIREDGKGNIYVDINKSATSITSLPVSASDDHEEIYDLTGRRIANLQRGLNIVRTSRGTVRKVFKQ